MFLVEADYDSAENLIEDEHSDMSACTIERFCAAFTKGRHKRNVEKVCE